MDSIEAAVLDQATAARTIAELEAEISTLRQLERQAHQLLVSGTDRKWEELSSFLQSRAMVTSQGGTTQTGDFYRTPRHSRLPSPTDTNLARSLGSGGYYPRRPKPEAATTSPRNLHPRQRGLHTGGHRCCRRRHQFTTG